MYNVKGLIHMLEMTRNITGRADSAGTQGEDGPDSGPRGKSQSVYAYTRTADQVMSP